MQTMSSDKTYNGWSNYETWCVNLWLSNDEGTYLMVRESAKTYADGHPNVDAGIWTTEEATRFSLADQLKSECEEMAPDLGSSMFADLLNAALSEVDWEEIAANILSE